MAEFSNTADTAPPRRDLGMQSRDFREGSGPGDREGSLVGVGAIILRPTVLHRTNTSGVAVLNGRQGAYARMPTTW
jgi:hypothetical protein